MALHVRYLLEMMQRLTDALVLRFFSLVYGGAVRLLRLRQG